MAVFSLKSKPVALQLVEERRLTRVGVYWISGLDRCFVPGSLPDPAAQSPRYIKHRYASIPVDRRPMNATELSSRIPAHPSHGSSRAETCLRQCKVWMISRHSPIPHRRSSPRFVGQSGFPESRRSGYLCPCYPACSRFVEQVGTCLLVRRSAKLDAKLVPPES